MATNNVSSNPTSNPANPTSGNAPQKPAMSPTNTGERDQIQKNREHLSEMGEKVDRERSGRAAGPEAQGNPVKTQSAASDPSKD